VLAINKLDQGFLELQLEWEMFYNSFSRQIEMMNNVIDTYRDDAMGDMQVDPAQGSVAFTAGRLYIHKRARISTKESYMSTKEPYTSAKEQYASGPRSCQRLLQFFLFARVRVLGVGGVGWGCERECGCW